MLSAHPVPSRIGKNMSIKHHLEAGVGLALKSGIGLLSPSVSAAAGGGLLRFIGPRLRAHRTALRNVQRCFGNSGHTTLIDGIWNNLGRTLFEYPHLHRLQQSGCIEICGLEHLQAASALGRGGIFLSAHLANWECTPFLLNSAQVPTTILYRAPNNPYMRDMLQRFRPQGSTRFVPKSMSGTKQAFQALARGEYVGLLIDHRYNRGIEVNFLGGQAIIAPTAALMALCYQAPLMPVRCERLDSGKYRVSLSPPLAFPDSNLPVTQQVQIIMQQAFTLLE